MTFASLTFDAQSAVVALCGVAQALVLFIAQFAFRGQGRPPKELALLAGSCVGVNLGTFCYPLVEAVWGSEGLSRVVLFDAVNQWSLLIVAPLIYASSIAGASFSPVKALANVRKQLLSPCLMAMFVAVGLRLMGASLPGPVVAFTSSLWPTTGVWHLAYSSTRQLKDGQIRDIITLLRYDVIAPRRCHLSDVCGEDGDQDGSASSTAVVLAALISPVPLLTVTYAMVRLRHKTGARRQRRNFVRSCVARGGKRGLHEPAALAPAVAAAGRR